MAFQEFLANPPENQEWVDGWAIAKPERTIKHSKLQAKLARLWGNYAEASGLGGDVYTELPCMTRDRVRRPDVGYLSNDLARTYGNEPVLPQSPPLIAEIASPTDYAETLFAKAQEYLGSGCLEVWLIFGETHQVLVKVDGQTLGFEREVKVKTQKVLPGFSIALADLWV